MNEKVKKELWKLGLLEAEMISAEGLDLSDLPEDVVKDGEHYYQIKGDEIDPDELELFLKLKNARNINIIRKCAVVCAVCLAIPFVCAALWFVLSMLA